MDGAEGRRALLRQEAMLAIVINAAISVGFFFLVFGWAPVTARGMAIDFFPQSAGVTFLGTFIPSLITYGRITRGTVKPAGPVPSQVTQLLRVLVTAAVAVLVFGGAAALLTVWLAPATIAPLPALIVKAAYGAALGRIVTPPVIRSVLGMPMFGRERAAAVEGAR